jgi:hypothetical protein
MKTASGTANLFDWTVIRKAIKRTLTSGPEEALNNGLLSKNQGIEITVLINDIFGGEILKTPGRKGWHFYNQIDGVRIDLGSQEIDKSFDAINLENISSSRSDTSNYFKQEDYSNFFMRFIRAFEETVGLDKCQPA